VARFRPQPNWDFLLSASRTEIGNLLDRWLEDHSDAAVARLLLTHPRNAPMNTTDAPRASPVTQTSDTPGADIDHPSKCVYAHMLSHRHKDGAHPPNAQSRTAPKCSSLANSSPSATSADDNVLSYVPYLYY
jgi:hypothetical protein